MSTLSINTIFVPLGNTNSIGALLPKVWQLCMGGLIARLSVDGWLVSNTSGTKLDG